MAPVDDFREVEVSGAQPALPLVNSKRVAARALRFWYLIVLSVTIFMAGAYIYNRYATRIYPITASIIIKENEESLGAKFLYNNELVNPYRNHYNEIFIMRSYPLLQEVVEELRFDVALFREGDIKTTEFYDPDFPLQIQLVRSGLSANRPIYISIESNQTYRIEYPNPKVQTESRLFENLRFGDTVQVNGYRLAVHRKGDLTPWTKELFKVVFTDPFQLARGYSSRLKLTWAQVGASVVNLEIQGAVVRKEVDFLTKFIERYQQYDIDKKTRESRLAISFLDRQLVVMGDSLRLYEGQIEAFKKRNVVTNLKGETERLYQRLVSLEEQLFRFQLLENYGTYVRELLSNDRYDGIFTPASVGVDDDVLSALIAQLLEEQAQVNLYRSNDQKGVDKSADNPALQSKLGRIKLIKADILKVIENARVTRSINKKFIEGQTHAVERQLASLPATERELVDIQRNYALKENLYTYLLQKRAEAGISEASTTSDIVVVNPPVAGSAITPQPLQNYGIALALGVLFPLLGFVVAELVNTRIQSKEDITKLTTLPIIGGVGHNPEDDAMVVFAKPKSVLAESFRALRSNLSYFIGKQKGAALLVTSSIPGEGKSFTTLNLASVYAMSGLRTVIIGADLRRPKLFTELHLRNDRGLSQYLSDLCTLDEAIQVTEKENLFLIAGGATPPNPSELLLKPKMAELLHVLRGRFDVIILDTPPLGFVTDAFSLVPLVDHVVFMVRQNYTPRQALFAIQEHVVSGRLANASIIFNDIRKSGLGYGYGDSGYGYGYGYDYGYAAEKRKGISGYYS